MRDLLGQPISGALRAEAELDANGARVQAEGNGGVPGARVGRFSLDATATDPLGRPAVHVPLPDALAERKSALLHEHYASQRDRDWFDRDTFLGLLRLRGVECRARYAEAFHLDKAVLGLPSPGGAP